MMIKHKFIPHLQKLQASFLNTFLPLPLPAQAIAKIQKISIPHQMAIAFMLNILSLALPIMMLQIYDRIIPHQSYSTLIMLITGVLVALTVDATLRIIRSWLVGWSATSQEHITGCTAIERLIEADLPIFKSFAIGEHLQNLSALSRLREFYSGQAMTALVDLPFATLFLLLIAYLGGGLVWVPITLLAIFLACAFTAGGKLRAELEVRSLSDDRKASLVVAALSGIHTIKSIAMESLILRRFDSAQDAVTENSYRVAMASGLTTTLSAAFGQLSLILTAIVGCLFVLQGQMSVGGLSACTLLAGRAIQPIQRVLGTWMRLQDLAVAREQAGHLFALPVHKCQTQTPLFAAHGRVILERVSFSYEPHKPFLKDISLRVEPGQVVAIRGDKASGKSTLLQLIAGLLSPQQGMIRIDDINPAEYSPSILSKHIGYMPQQGAIFRGTILENMTGFRKDEETLCKAKNEAAILGLDDIIDLLPRGYLTVLSDTVADPVPPGVKQRIALTRTLINSPSLLLFDDADRTLDKEGYNRLFRVIGRLKGRCTLLLVSHDHNLVSFSDRFYKLENGMLIPDDTPFELAREI